MNSFVLYLGKPAPCGQADLEEGVGRALDGGRSRSHSLVQIAEASKHIWHKCQPACSCWGKSRPYYFVYYLGLDSHLVALAGKRGVLWECTLLKRKGLAGDEKQGLLTLGLERERPGLEEFAAWVEKQDLEC